MNDNEEAPTDDDANPGSDEAKQFPSQSLPIPDKVISAEYLFGEATEIGIEYEGQMYRLRITRRKRLILQK